MRARDWMIAACAVLACSGESRPDASTADAGVDATSIDAGADGGFDAPIDVGHDAADVDAGPDPGWERLPGYPDECYLERARHPENALAFHWETCIDSLPSCQMVVFDRGSLPLTAIAPLGGGNESARRLLWELREPGRGHEILIVSDDARPRLAWRLPYAVDNISCAPIIAGGAAGIGTDMGFFRASGGTDYVSVADWSSLATFGDVAWTSTSSLIPAGDFLQTGSASATTFAATLLSGNILAVEPPNAEIVGRGDLGPVVVGRSVLYNWGDTTGATGIHVSRIGGPDTELYRAPEGVYALGVRSDGAWIVWRSFTASSTTRTMWVAPYRETPPLDVRSYWHDLVGGGASGTIGDGMFAYGAGDVTTSLAPMVAVVDLTDGSRRRYEVPYTFADGSGWRISSDPAWVTRDEVAVPAGRHSPTGPSLLSVLRIDITSLPVEHFADADAGVDAGP